MNHSLVGMANVQVFMYFMWYPRDPLSTKLGVVWLWYVYVVFQFQRDSEITAHRLLDVLHLLFCFDMVYIADITDFANPFGLLTVAWSTKVSLYVTAHCGSTCT